MTKQENDAPEDPPLPSRRAMLTAFAVTPIVAAATARSAQAATLTDSVVPPGAVGPPIDPNLGYHLEEIGEDLYWITDGAHDTVFLVSSREVLVVDAPTALGAKLLAAIGSVTRAPVRSVIYSHAHADHIGATYLYGDQVKITAHRETRDLLEQAADPHRPLPTEVFDRHHRLSFGRHEVELTYPGPQHQPGNIFIRFPAQDTLMVVDICAPGWVAYGNFFIAQNVPGFLNTYDQILQTPFTKFVGGHLTRYGSREDLVIGKQYVDDVMSITRAALLDTPLGPIAARIGRADPWKLINAYHDAIIDKAEDQVNAKWRGILGGADAFTRANCYTAEESTRIDFGIGGG